MRNTRMCVVCGLLVAAAAAVAPSVGQAATRPHPLFGHPIIGNSAELVTMWPTGSGGIDSLRISDFIYPPGLLRIKPSGACTGGLTTAKYQQLDVATGDLDGDGRDDMVAAYSMPTADTWIQRVMLEIPDVRSGPLDWTTSVSAPQGYLAMERNAYRSPSNVRLATGNFDSDEAKEFVLGTRVQRNFRGTLDAGDIFGASVAAIRDADGHTIGDVDGDGIGDLVVGAPNDDDGGTDRGAVWILFLRRDGTVRWQQKISDTQGGFTGVLDNSDKFGCAVAGLGDHDHDGIPDIAVGAYGDDDGGTDRGAVWLLHLNPDGTTKDFIKLSDTSGTPLAFALDNSDYFGDRLTSIGDFDGDGFDDLAVAATADDDGGTDRGAVYIVLLNATGAKSTSKISDTSNTPASFALDNGDRFGFGIAYVRSFDGAGNRMLAVGAPYDDDGGSNVGAVWLMFLSADGSVFAWTKLGATAGNPVTGLGAGDTFGASVAVMPDQDGDSVCELAIGANSDDDGGTDRGAVYIVYLNALGASKYNLKISDTAGNFTGEIYNYDYFGVAVACPGDLDGDGRADLVVGANGADFAYSTQPYDTGDLWFVYLGDVTLVKGQMENGAWWDGAIQLELMELDVSGQPQVLASTLVQSQDDDLKESTRFDITVGDFDGDGFDDIAVGGVRRRGDNNMELFVRVYTYDGVTLTEMADGSYGNITPGVNSNGEGYTITHVAMAAGPLGTTSSEQILFSWQEQFEDWWETTDGCVWPFNQWKWRGRRTPYLSTLTVGTGGSWTIGWGVPLTAPYVEQSHGSSCTTDGRYYHAYTGSSLGLAVGDLTGDGRDEVVWSELNNVRVYQADPVTFSLAERGASLITRTSPWSDPARRVVEIADLDAAADASTWRPEIIVQDWDGSLKQRIRVFGVQVDGSGAITDLPMRFELAESQVAKKDGDVAMTCGNFDGDGFRVGTPAPKRHIDEVVRPLVVLGAPPVHFDVFDDVPVDVNGCYPGDGTYGCSDFTGYYSQEETSELEVSVESTRDWGLSAELKGWAEGFGLKVEGSLKATYGENFERTTARNQAQTFTSAVSTDGRDKVLADRISYDLWEYPVYNGDTKVGDIAVIDPGSHVMDQVWQPYEQWIAGGGTVSHEPGNILSYWKTLPDSVSPYGYRWKAQGTGFTVGSPVLAMSQADLDCPGGQQCFDLHWSDVCEDDQQNGWKAGLEVGAKITYEAEDPLGEFKAGASLEVNGHYDASELQTHKVQVGTGVSMRATVGHLAPNIAAAYTVFPFVYRSATTGTLVLDYRVVPNAAGAAGGSWWDVYRGAPDLTFILPRLNREAKGDTTDPGLKYISPDIRIIPASTSVGEVVTIRAMVRNFSLMDYPGDAVVRFFAGDPDGDHFAIHDSTGKSDFVLHGPLPSREGREISIRWRVPTFTPTDVKVFAVVDPDGAVSEVHENNNKGFAEFHAVGGNPLDVPAQTAGMPFRLEQSAPNPFRGSTLIAFGLPERTRVRLTVYDIAGRLITTIVDADLAPGRHEYRWDGRGRDGSAVRPGVYLYRINAGPYGETRRLVRVN